MARLLEQQGKQLLAAKGICVPEGGLARTAEEVRSIAARLGFPLVIKAQVASTNRARAGLLRFAEKAEDLSSLPPLPVRVERRLPFVKEFYLGYLIDDRERRPLLLLSAAGGSGIEERTESVATLAVSVTREPSHEALLKVAHQAGAPESITAVLLGLYRLARDCEARSAEINPLALTAEGQFVALDCRLSVDDYAVFRHPELDIEIARELSRPPTDLDRIAWSVERDDYRGTFYFVESAGAGDGVLVGFHGAGGGGSMASLDAAQRCGLKIANYTDLSGNPPASKVYRAAKIILSQPGIRGYFSSGSGVASQEQFHIARGLVKAFREDGLAIPAVLRLGGNGEDLAGAIIKRYAEESGARTEAYTKNQSADFCARRLKALIEAGSSPAPGRRPVIPAARQPYSFATRTGWITYDHAVCKDCSSKACVKECPAQILEVKDGAPVLKITQEEARRGRCTECLACEVECWYQGASGARIDLPIPGLEEFRAAHGHNH